MTAEPTAAEIEAAARALWGASADLRSTNAAVAAIMQWDGLPEFYAELERARSRAALAAVLPLVEARLREQIAAEIEAAEVAGLEPGPGGLGPAARWGLGLAARIARGR